MKIYYAHSLGLYNTPQEKRDVELLEKLGFEVLNPNTPEQQKEYDEWRKGVPDNQAMSWFEKLLNECDGLAYRSFVDLKIGSGVYFEINHTLMQGKPVFELPTITKSRELDVAETRNYLKLTGQR